MLEKERSFYEQQLPEYLNRYSGRFVVVKGQELIGVYERIEDALTEATRLFGLDSYLLRQVLPVQLQVSIPALSLGILNADSSSTVRS